MRTLIYTASRMNRYYKLTNFYPFLRSILIKGGLTILAVLLVVFLVDRYLIDIDSVLNILVSSFTELQAYTVFLISETFFGILPPEIFIAWGSKLVSPWISLFILASLSYLGGVFAYLIGARVREIPNIRSYIFKKLNKEVNNLRKWGGLLVIVGAMLPIPHSIVSMCCGLINYQFKNYLLWALFRFLRFLIYGLIIFQMI